MWTFAHQDESLTAAGSNGAPLDIRFIIGVAMIDALRSVDPAKRLGEEVGYVSRADLVAIERALAFVLDLD